MSNKSDDELSLIGVEPEDDAVEMTLPDGTKVVFRDWRVETPFDRRKTPTDQETAPMRITFKIDRFTQLRADMRKAFLAGDQDAIHDSGSAFYDYMLERWRNGGFSDTEELWLDQHPKCQDYLEGPDDMPDFYDDLRLFTMHGR